MPESIPEAPQNFGWKDFTASGRISERDMQWVYDAFIKHLGQDYWNSRNDYPHPNQSVSTLNFFEGNGRLSDDGIEILANDSSARRIKWVREFNQPYTNPGYISYLAGFVGSLQSEQYGQALFESNYAGYEFIANTNLGRARLTAGTLSGSGYAQLISDEASGLTYFEMFNSELVLDRRTSDYGSVFPGGMWFRTDTNKFKGGLNGGTVVDFVTSADLPLPVTLTNLDVPYTASSSTPVTLTTSETILAMDATTGNKTVNLPSAATATSGLIYMIKKVDSSANTVIIDPSGTQTIDGATTFTLTKQNSVLAIVSDGSNWRILWYWVPDSSTISTKTGAYTVVSGDRVILADATAAAFTVSLPAAASSTGMQVAIKKIDSTVNAVTIDPSGAETIDGFATIAMESKDASVLLACNGTSWYIVSSHQLRSQIVITGAYAATTMDSVIVVGGLANFTVTLPPAASCKGQILTFVRAVTGLGNITTIDPNGTELINGQATYAMSARFNAVQIISAGTAWFVVSES